MKRKNAGIITSGIILLASIPYWLIGAIETMHVEWHHGLFEKFLGLWYMALTTLSFVYGLILIHPDTFGRKSGIVVCILSIITSIYLMFDEYWQVGVSQFIAYLVAFILILANYNRLYKNNSLKEPEESTQEFSENEKT
jgi:hypothetical protein